MPKTDIPGPVRIIPYTRVDGVPTYKDSEIKGFFKRIVRDGLKDIVFHAGDIRTPQDFLKEARDSRRMILYVVYAGNLEAGLIWLTHFEARTCRCHFTSFSETWGMDTVSIGRAAISQVMYGKAAGGEYLFDVLLGLTPSANIRAIRWLEKVGLKKAGEVPSILWDDLHQKTIPGTLMYLTRDCIPQLQEV